ncbi:MAG: hypothetical protein IJD20_06405, partial [Oscillospiraceae bacterium]|nr:hypothetical protein [Oscillospiraceae bacterium]
MNKKLSRVLAMLLSLCMVFALVACGGEEQTGNEGGGAAVEKILKQSTSGAATTLNPHMSQQANDNNAIAYITSPLYGYILDQETNRGKLSPILAADVPTDVSGDGTVWQIKVNEKAQWHNGDPINADTFMYSWKMCLDPKLVTIKAS